MSSGEGGGIFNNQGFATIERNEIRNNQAVDGGGIDSEGGSATIRFNTIHSNSSTTLGGGIAIDNLGGGGGSFVIQANLIYSNSAQTGGGLADLQGDATIWNNIIYENVSTSQGGGIFVDGNALIWNNTVVSNTASATGGGIDLFDLNLGDGTASISNTIVVSNTAGTNGGGINNNTGTVSVHYSTIAGNTPDQVSGGVTLVNPVGGLPTFVDPAGGDFHLSGGAQIDGGDPGTTVPDDIDGEGRPFGSSGNLFDVGADEVYTASACYARNDTDGRTYADLQAAVGAAASGDTIKVAGRCRSTASQVLLITQTLTVRGGYTVSNWLLPVSGPTFLDGEGARRAVLITGTSAVQPVLEGFHIISGSVAGRGGGVYIGGAAAPVVQNNFIYGNTATDGGGLANEAGNGNLWNNTIVFNTASGNGGGVYNNTGAPAISNTIIVSNTAATGGAVYNEAGGSAPNLAYNDVTGNSAPEYSGVAAASTSISDNPQFVDPASGDFHLSLTSPAQASADPNTSLTNDIDNDTRPLGGLQDFDIGADEADSYAGVLFTPDFSRTVESNSVVVFSHRITNAGTISDTFSLTHTASVTWTVNFSSSVDLAAGQAIDFPVSVTVPAEAAPGMPATFSITATSQTNGKAGASVQDRVTVLPTFKVDIEPSFTGPDAIFAEPQEIITLTHIVTNTGNFTDAYRVTTVDPLGWGPVVMTSVVVMTPTDQLTITLAQGATETVRMQVTVPLSAEKNLQNNINIVATSVSTNVASDLVTDTITAKGKAGSRHVAPPGSGGSDVNNSCLDPTSPCATIAKALDQAFSLDTIKVAKGAYTETEVILINKAVTLSGGWTPVGTVDGETVYFHPDLRSANPALTIIDGGNAHRVLDISSNATVEGFTIRNGRFNGGVGGGVFIQGAAPTIQGNIIIDNSAGTGGGIYATGSANPSIYNNVIANNQAANGGDGGGVYLNGGQARLFNNTLYGNNAQDLGGGLYSNGAVAVISNTIVATNTATGGSSGLHRVGGAITLNYNLFFDNTSSEPLGGTNFSADPAFVNAAGDDFHLTGDSPALDAGDPNTTLSVDFEGQIRPVNQGFDVGADELAGCLAHIEGDPVETVYGNLQEAVDVAQSGQTVQVYGHCRGVHPLSVGGQVISQTLHLTKTITVRGGYDASFNYNPANNTTILDAQNLGRGVFITGTISPRLEDLTITNGDASGLGGGPGGADAGGGIYNFNGDPIFYRNTISNNTAAAGGGFYNDSGAPRLERDPADTNPDDDQPHFQRNFISDNTATDGGGFYNRAGGPVFSNVFIHDNTATNGGGFYNAGGAPALRNTVIFSNTGSNGGGLYNAASSQLLVLNNTFYGNNATTGGAAYNAGGVLTATNNIFANNTASSGAGGIESSGGTALATYNDATGNTLPHYSAGVTQGGGNIFDVDPNFVEVGNFSAGMFHLSQGSPVEDQGDPGAHLTYGLTFDMDGDFRPSNQSSDIGADELGGCLARVVSSGQIFGSVQVAVDAAQASGDTVQVSGYCGGTHTVDIGGTVFTQTVHLTKTINLEGGWKDDFSEQDPLTYITTLDAISRGHVIYVGSGVTPTIKFFHVVQGRAANGGGIYNDGGSPVVTGTYIYSNTATANGGGFYNDGGNPILEGGNYFHDNSAANGGAIYNAAGGGLLVQNNFIYSNTATNGGGFYSAAGDPTVRHNTFHRNGATSGGAMYIAAGGPDLRANIVINQAGGGVFAAGGASPAVQYNDFFGNAGGDFNGSLDGTNLTGADPLLTDPDNANFHLPTDGSSPAMDAVRPITSTLVVDFEGHPRPTHQFPDIGADEADGCYARLRSAPGTVYGSPQLAVELAAAGETVDVAGTCLGVHDFSGNNYNLHVTKNITVTGGWNTPGVPQANDPVFKLKDVTAYPTFLDAQGGGRVVYASGAPTVEDFHIVNGAGTNGGGVYVAGGAALIQANHVHSNTATTGAGIYNNAGTTLIYNNFVYNNTGDGIYDNAGTSAIWHNTVHGNTAEGIQIAAGGPVIHNNIVMNNGGAGISGSGSLQTGYNDVLNNSPDYSGGVGAGTGSLSVDPSFTGQFLLQASSPVVDVADPASPVVDDFEDDPRPTDDGFDMGADEFNTCLARVSSTGQIFGRVQDAIDAAASPDTILIAHPEEVSFGECKGVRTTGPGTQAMYINKDLTIEGSYREDKASGGFLKDDTPITTGVDAGRGGRVAYVPGGVSVTLKDLTLENGDAGAQDGGVVFNAGTLSLSGSELISGTAQNGGVLYNAGILTATATTFKDGVAAGDGGVIYNNAEADLIGSGAQNGSANRGGVTFNSATGDLFITGGDFYKDGIAATDGGGHYNAGLIEFRNSGVRDSVANRGGGVFNAAGASNLVATNFYVISNTARSGGGGGLYNEGGGLSLFFNTLFDNVATTDGGGVYNQSGSLTISSTILYTNTALARGGGLFDNTGGGSAVYNDYYDNTAGTSDPDSNLALGSGALQVDPLLSGILLLKDSPVIDQADPNSHVTDDAFLKTRPQPDPVPPFCGGFDMGADEYPVEIDFKINSPQNEPPFTVAPGTPTIYDAHTLENHFKTDPVQMRDATYTNTYTITVVSDPEGWATVANTLPVTLGPLETTPVQILISIPAGTTGGMTETLRVQVQTICTKGGLPVTREFSNIIMAATDYAAELAPNNFGAAAPGQTITYSHILTNTGNLATDYIMTTSAGPFSTASVQPGLIQALPPLATSTVTVTVTLKDTAPGGEQDIVNVAAIMPDFSQAVAADTTAISFTSATRYVDDDGSDFPTTVGETTVKGNNCSVSSQPCATIQQAVDQASAGDMLLVSQGTYTGVLTQTVGGNVIDQIVFIDKSITIEGGYTSADWNLPSRPISRPTVLDANGLGRAVYVRGGSVTAVVAGLQLVDGDASGQPSNRGGAVYNEDASLTLRANAVSNNQADRGGAIYNQAGTLLMQNNAVYNNSALPAGVADDGGGGLYLESGTATLHNNTFYGNDGLNGGAVHHRGGTLGITNTILAQNVARTENGGSGGAVYSNGGSHFLSYNFDFGNTTPSLVGLTNVQNTFTGDPLLANPGAGDFHLTDGEPPSPAIDAGIPISGLDADFDNDPRPQGVAFDIGADELLQEPGVLVEPDYNVAVDTTDVNTYTHYITNTAQFTDTFDLTFSSSQGWGVLQPTTNPVTLPPGGAVTVTVVVTAGSPGFTDFSTITATSQASATTTISDTATITTYVRQVHGLSFFPDRQSNADPGTVVTYTHTLSNTGNGLDTFTLTRRSDFNWPLTVVPSTTITLLPNVSATVTVTVAVPPDAISSTVHTALITATSVVSPAFQATVVDTTTVNLRAGLLLFPDFDRTADPGQTITNTHTISNSSNYTATINLTANSSQGWGNLVTASPLTDLGPFQSAPVVMTVTVPPGAAAGLFDLTTITATTSLTPGLLATASDTTTVNLKPGVTLAPDNAQTTGSNTVVTYTHTITNEGNGTDTFTLTVASSQGFTVTTTPPATITLTADQTATITVTVNVPPGSGGLVDVATVTARSQSDALVQDSAVNTTTVIQVAGVELAPDRSSQALAGGAITYTHTITNSGDGTDTFTLTVSSSQGWSVTTAPPATITLTAGQTATITATVLVPAGVLSDTVDTTHITATSVLSSGVFAVVTNTTTVGLTPGVDLSPGQNGLADAGAPITYTHVVTNLGNFTDTFTLSAASSQGWPFSNTPSIQLGPGLTGTITLTLNVPPATGGLVDTLTVTATSTLSATVFDVETNTTTVNQRPGVELAPDNTGLASDGGLITYTHIITNSGDGFDTFTLSSSSSQGWTVDLPASVALSATLTQTLVVTVNVPAGSGGLIDVTVITATSGLSNSVQASAVDTTTVIAVPGVDLEPDRSSLAFTNRPVTYTHTLTNTGNGPDQFRIEASSSQGWTVTPPFTVSLAYQGVQNISIVVIVPPAVVSGTVDTTLVTATSVLSNAVFDVVTDTTTIRESPGVDLSPGQNNVTDPGVVVSYLHTVTNTGNVSDTVNLTAGSSQGWAGPVSPASLFLTPGQTGTVSVTLTVPALTGGLIDTTTLTATSTFSSAVFDVESNVTSVRLTPGVELTPNNLGSDGPGATLAYTHTLTNTGDGFDTFNLTITSSQGWPVSVLPGTINLGPGMAGSVQVMVNIPSAAVSGTVDTAIVTATSAASPSVFAQATDRTTVIETIRVIYLPLVLKDYDTSGPPTPTPTPTATPGPTPTPTPTPQSGPDLVVTDITIAPASPVAGQAATVFVTVQNQGDQPVAFGNNFFVDFYVDRVPARNLAGDIAWGVQGRDFGVGQSVTFSAAYIFASSGAHQVYAQADTDNTVVETDEGNNVLGPQTVNIGAPDTTGAEPPAGTATPTSTPAPAGDVPRQTPTPVQR
ncbi:MAG: beta strand repeat-containing protein [Anaerolineae bacterium]